MLFVGACAISWLALEFGYRFGKWRHARTVDEKETPVGAMVASILALLAFLLAFTFGMAATRYEARRQTVLDEANAIGTTYLRARLLPEPQRTETASLLREYVDVRVASAEERELAEFVARSEQLHELIWQEGMKASENKNGTPVITSLFLQSLNQMIDLHATRIHFGLRNRIPFFILAALFSLALLSMAAIGYQAGISDTRRSPAMVGVVLAFAGVLFLIADLDRPREGFLTVSQQAMLDLQRSMHSEQEQRDTNRLPKPTVDRP
jgi:hypothetical protein